MSPTTTNPELQSYMIRVTWRGGDAATYTTLAKDLAHAKRLSREWAARARELPVTKLDDLTSNWRAVLGG